jgi:pilus assembly protein CpaB
VKKQHIAAVAAVLLAALGVFSLISYAQGANNRAFADTKMVEVLRVQTDIPSGTPDDRVAGSVKLVEIPAVAKVAGALTTLTAVKGKSTNASLNVGEQVVADRFGGAVGTKSPTTVPKGFQEVSVSVAGPRVAGGKLKAGDKVGVVVSYAHKDGTVGDTSFTLDGVLVTRVASSATAGDDSTPALLVTFAVNGIDAEKIVNASEFGKVWLTLQNGDTQTGTGRRISAKDVI